MRKAKGSDGESIDLGGNEVQSHLSIMSETLNFVRNSNFKTSKVV